MRYYVALARHAWRSDFSMVSRFLRCRWLRHTHVRANYAACHAQRESNLSLICAVRKVSHPDRFAVPYLLACEVIKMKTVSFQKRSVAIAPANRRAVAMKAAAVEPSLKTAESERVRTTADVQCLNLRVIGRLVYDTFRIWPRKEFNRV
jgi:hypothetical protein